MDTKIKTVNLSATIQKGLKMENDPKNCNTNQRDEGIRAVERNTKYPYTA
jgi:hypothetical protein